MANVGDRFKSYAVSNDVTEICAKKNSDGSWDFVLDSRRLGPLLGVSLADLADDVRLSAESGATEIYAAKDNGKWHIIARF